MKILFCCIIALTFFDFAHSQNEMPSKDGMVFYEAIDSSVTASAKELYNRAKLFIADEFKDSKQVIRLDDPENSTIVGKGNFRFYQGIPPYRVSFTMKIVTKDNKYRAQFYDVIIASGTQEVEQGAEALNKRKGGDKVKEKVNKGMEDLINGLAAAMKKKADNDF